MTKIKAKKDLFNNGQCFTKGNTYTIQQDIRQPAGLMEAQIVNDLGQPHIIGGWWRHFDIVKLNRLKNIIGR